MLTTSRSRYACFGLWVIDLRQLHYPLDPLLSSNPKFPSFGPLQSYPHLTELTRNPPESRGSIEKNWMFFSTSVSTYVHYDIGPATRSFAKLLGGGLSTPNLTDPLEQPCLQEGALKNKDEDLGGSWHQATNSLRLILCERSDGSCRSRPENTVFWSLIHHKHKNVYHLPLRYERYFVIWSSTPPFNMLAMSSHPILLANETAGGWDPAENWDDDAENEEMVANYGSGKENFAVFTYTVSIAYSWGRFDDQPQDKYTGFLNDEVIIGVGVDDEAQNYARIPVSELLQCMHVCPPRADEPLDGSADPEFMARKKAEQEAGVVKSAFDDDRFGGADEAFPESDTKVSEDDALGDGEKTDEVTEELLEQEALFEEKKKLAQAKDTSSVLQVATSFNPTATGIPASAEKARELVDSEKAEGGENEKEKEKAKPVAQVENIKKIDGEKVKADVGQAKDKSQPSAESERAKIEKEKTGVHKDSLQELQQIKAATGNMPRPDEDYGGGGR